jgi:malonyl-CoA/methylmalonyl-CoA synthetase
MGLSGLGVAPGDRVVWEAASTPDAIVAALGALRLGAVLVPVGAGQSDIERATILLDVGAAVLIGAPRANHDRAIPHRSAGELERQPTKAVDLDTASEEDLALIIFTSGTTGRPKGAMITHGNLVAQATSLGEAWGWTSSDRLLSALPLFHVHGLVVALLTSLTLGGGIVVRSKFEVEDFLGVIHDEAITMSFCVPTMLHRLADAPGVERVASLRLLVSGSAPLPVQLHQQFADLGAPILERYGMTESLLTFSNPLEGERRAGTVGFALPGVSADLPDRGGPEQELKVKGPGVFRGYWNRPDATAEIFDDGWLKTGDIVRVDQDGYLIICGRSKELIITGGFNVYPGEIEDVLRSLPSIVDAAVVGEPSEEWGEAVVAFVVVETADFDVHAALESLRQMMSAYKVPRRIEIIDALPRNAMGKIQRSLLQ